MLSLLKLSVVGLASTSVSANLLQKKVADSHGVKRLFSQVGALSMNELESLAESPGKLFTNTVEHEINTQQMSMDQLESLAENPNKLFGPERHLLRASAPHTALGGIPITPTEVRVQSLQDAHSAIMSRLQQPFENVEIKKQKLLEASALEGWEWKLGTADEYNNAINAVESKKLAASV